MSMKVRVVLGSMCVATGEMIFTLELRYWRGFHSELMTHRALSRNAGSSRAKPVKKVLSQVWNDPAGPTHWGVNRAGMQAREQLTGWRLALAKRLWKWCGRAACGFAYLAMKCGLHKQVANRMLEPWQWIDVLVTATDWSNFFELRAHPDAQPEFQELAVAMREAISTYAALGKVQNLMPGDWHIPYMISDEDHLSLKDKVKLSTARCARVSYEPFDGDASHDKEFARHDLLVGSKPIHASPTEHQAVCTGTAERFANFHGFRQYRHFIEAGQTP